MSSSCPRSIDLVRLLDGEVTRNEEARLRAHLESCGACREESVNVEQLLGDLAAPLARVPSAGADSILRAIQEGRQAPPIPARRPVAKWTAAFGLLAAAAGVLFLVAGRGGVPGQEFQARGGAAGLAARVGITLYAPIAHRVPLREGTRIGSQTAFTASYRNLEEKQPVHLLLFGVDARGELHWLYPAFTDGHSDPVAIRLPFNRQETALPESVVLDGPALGTLRLFSVVTPDAVHVSTIESLPRSELTPTTLERRLPRSHVEALSVVLVGDEKGTTP
jgi:hypothetical protein